MYQICVSLLLQFMQNKTNSTIHTTKYRNTQCALYNVLMLQYRIYIISIMHYTYIKIISNCFEGNKKYDKNEYRPLLSADFEAKI